VRTVGRPVSSVPPRATFAGFRYPPEVILLAMRWYLEELSYLAGTRLVERVSEGESFQAGGFDSKRSVSTHSQRVREPVITALCANGDRSA
jgi:hypothetical protein